MNSNFLEDYVDIKAKLKQDKENSTKRVAGGSIRKSSFVAFSSGVSEDGSQDHDNITEEAVWSDTIGSFPCSAYLLQILIFDGFIANLKGKGGPHQ